MALPALARSHAHMHAHRCHNDPSASTAGHSHSPIVAIEVTAVNVTCSTARALSPGSSQQQCFRGQETGRAGQWGSGLPREASPPLPPPPQGPPAHRGVEHRQAQQECLQWHTHTRTHRQQARGVGPAGRNACMCGGHTHRQQARGGGQAGRKGLLANAPASGAGATACPEAAEHLSGGAGATTTRASPQLTTRP